MAAAAVAGTVAGQLVDGGLAALVVGGHSQVNPTAGSGDFLGDRIFATILTWLMPSYDGFGLDDVLLGSASLFGMLAVVVARRRPADVHGIRLFAVLAAGCAVARLVLPGQPRPRAAGRLPAAGRRAGGPGRPPASAATLQRRWRRRRSRSSPSP